MDILIIADYIGPLDGTINDRFLYLGDLLAVNNDVEIVTSDFSHGQKRHINGPIEKHDYQITLLHEVGYSKNICLKRFISDISWGISVHRYLKGRKKPDVIYVAVPPLTGAVVAANYCRHNKVRFVIDIQDLWPEAFKMVFNLPILSDLLFLPFMGLANYIYRKSDIIFAVSNTYADRASRVNKKVKFGNAVFLGTDLDSFDKNVIDYANIVLDEVGCTEKKDNEYWLAYCGSMSDSYDLLCVIDALSLIREKGGYRVKLIAMGDGYKIESYKKYATERHIDAFFTGRLPYKKMCALLHKCDIAVNPIIGKSAATIINKHADYTAAGLPVLNTQESPEYQELVDRYYMGYNCKNGDPIDLAEKITILLSDNNRLKSMGLNARKCAEEMFDRKKTYQLIVKLITESDTK